jgi:hypothetical protein
VGEGGRKGRTKKIPNAEVKSFFREAQELPYCIFLRCKPSFSIPKYIYCILQNNFRFGPIISCFYPQSTNIKSTTVYVPLTHLTWGGHTRREVRGWESPNSDDWRKSLALCLLCAFTRRGIIVNIFYCRVSVSSSELRPPLKIGSPPHLQASVSTPWG